MDSYRRSFCFGVMLLCFVAGKKERSVVEKVDAAHRKFGMREFKMEEFAAAPGEMFGHAISCSVCHYARMSAEESAKKLPTAKEMKKTLKDDICSKKFNDLAGQLQMSSKKPDKEATTLCNSLVDAFVPDVLHRMKERKDLTNVCVENYKACPKELDHEFRKMIQARRKVEMEKSVDDFDNLEAQIDELAKKKGLKGEALKKFKNEIGQMKSMKELKNMRTTLEEKSDDMSMKEAKDMTKNSLKQAEKLQPEDKAMQARKHAETMQKIRQDQKKTSKQMREAMKKMKKIRGNRKTGDPTLDKLAEALDSVADRNEDDDPPDEELDDLDDDENSDL